MSIYNDYKTKKNEYFTFLNSNKNDIFNSAIEELKLLIPDVKTIGIIGYTPGFNDGEPCTHSSYSFFDDFGELIELSDYNSEVLSCFNIPEDVLDEDESDIYDWISDNTSLKLTSADRQLGNAIMSDLEALAEDIWYTDFIIMVDLSENTPVVKHIEYQCGY
ncbi:hypothetical protein pEaSNUABM19_00157 [Erwinia phage pEa_SNUABM_19]|nr:hypothetical protein pEaSNUABM19_00157 [Erwinia phage pEa_SNUABM_19]QXO11851.1 hypothetical protein pEaSNUABM44_00155 [Erwinia phage pEa_SNUABM_44]